MIGYPYAKRRPVLVHGVAVEGLARLVRLPDGRSAQWWSEADEAVGGAIYAVSDGSWLTARALSTMTSQAYPS